MKNIVVVGGGPAGMMASIRAAALGAKTTLIEKNTDLGLKLLLSGKGRCNLTNACGSDDFLQRFPPQCAFLRDAFKKFFNRELMSFFEDRGLKLKIERQSRVFPETDRADSILDVLRAELRLRGVSVRYGLPAREIQISNSAVTAVVLADGTVLSSDRIILATGGISYPATGSTGEGFVIAKKLGHVVVPLRAGLVGLDTIQKPEPAGLTLRNIRLSLSDGTHTVESDIGELLFTHRGISGPLVFTASGTVVDWLAAGKKVVASIDLKPALSMDQLDTRVRREFERAPRKAIKTIVLTLIPSGMIEFFLERAGIKPLVTASHITRDERARLIGCLKSLRLDIKSARPVQEAMVTRGGVSLKEINPRTMESRRVKGLYFAGEILDVDADTGGFNLQAAFSTGYLAGESAATH